MLTKPYVRSFFALFFLFFTFFVFNRIGICSNGNSPFSLCPWQVGQFAEYRIIGYDNRGMDYKYRLSVNGREKKGTQDRFWFSLEIIRNSQVQISFSALVRPIKSTDFSRNPGIFLKEWIWLIFQSAEKIDISFKDQKPFSLAPNVFTSNDGSILKDTFYRTIPEYKSLIAFSRMKIAKELLSISVPSGIFSCYHFSVAASAKSFTKEEGLDIWRSPAVPFMGIVKMEFSKTKSMEKWDYHFKKSLNSSSILQSIYLRFFEKRVKRDSRFKDAFVMELVDFGNGLIRENKL